MTVILSSHEPRVPEVWCAHCVSTIERTVGSVDGVASVSVDLDDNVVRVDGGDELVICAALADAGCDADWWSWP